MKLSKVINLTKPKAPKTNKFISFYASKLVMDDVVFVSCNAELLTIELQGDRIFATIYKTESDAYIEFTKMLVDLQALPVLQYIYE